MPKKSLLKINDKLVKMKMKKKTANVHHHQMWAHTVKNWTRIMKREKFFTRKKTSKQIHGLVENKFIPRSWLKIENGWHTHTHNRTINYWFDDFFCVFCFNFEFWNSFTMNMNMNNNNKNGWALKKNGNVKKINSLEFFFLFWYSKFELLDLYYLHDHVKNWCSFNNDDDTHTHTKFTNDNKIVEIDEKLLNDVCFLLGLWFRFFFCLFVWLFGLVFFLIFQISLGDFFFFVWFLINQKSIFLPTEMKRWKKTLYIMNEQTKSFDEHTHPHPYQVNRIW